MLSHFFSENGESSISDEDMKNKSYFSKHEDSIFRQSSQSKRSKRQPSFKKKLIQQGSPTLRSPTSRKSSSPQRIQGSPLKTGDQDYEDPEMCIIHKNKRVSILRDSDQFKNYNEGFLKRNFLSSFDKRFKNNSK